MSILFGCRRLADRLVLVDELFLLEIHIVGISPSIHYKLLAWTMLTDRLIMWNFKRRSAS